MLSEPAPAKINLTLHVTGRRADGYHLLDSLVVFAAAADVVSVTPADGLSLAIGGKFGAALPATGDNLVLRAARALAEAAGVPARGALHLDKRLPVASGIGGGSADAAATLRVLARFWGVHLPPARLHALAAGLGADVPVCLAPRPQRMAGIGERLTAAPAMPACHMVLVNPGEALATQAVFRSRIGPFSAPAGLPRSWPDLPGMVADLERCTNDLEAPAVALCPAIGTVLAGLAQQPGALLARMSGSGATCFALFADPAQASQAAATLARPGWWCWSGPLYDPSADTL